MQSRRRASDFGGGLYDIDYIVVPIDFSRSSRAAWAMADSLAGPHTTVEAIHAVAPWPVYMNHVLFPYAPMGEDAAQIEHELLEAARDAVNSYFEVSDAAAEPVVAFGQPKSTLVEHIARTPSQLIVAGAFGEGGPTADAVGSVAERLVASAGRPVLLVRDLELKPGVSKILVALDLTEGSQAVLEVAVRLALIADAELEILHVVADPLADDQSQVMGSILNFDRKKAMPRLRDRVEALFERLVREIEPGFGTAVDVRELMRRRRVVVAEPASAILDLAQTSSADVVVVGTQNPNRPSGHLGRIATSVLRRTTSHVCVVPLSKRAQIADED